MPVIGWLGRHRRLCLLFAFAVSLHGVVDPLLTYYGVVVRGQFSEANPFIAWGIRGGLPRYVAIHIVLLAIVSLLFVALLGVLERADTQTEHRLRNVLFAGLVLIIGWGLLLVGRTAILLA